MLTLVVCLFMSYKKPLTFHPFFTTLIPFNLERDTDTETETAMGADTGLAMFCGLIHKIKPYLAMISLQFGYAGMYIVTMLCFKKGMNHYVLAVYRHVVATIVIAPFAFVLERFENCCGF